MEKIKEKDVVIVGAGPAGLSAVFFTQLDGWNTLILAPLAQILYHTQSFAYQDVEFLESQNLPSVAWPHFERAVN